MYYTENFNAYKEKVVNTYLQKQEVTDEDWLARPTRAKIRLRCIELVEQGLEKRDEAMLYNFLRLVPGDIDYLMIVKKKNAEYFKTMEQFLNDTAKNPKEKNVEMLAWLIGFEPRPFAVFKDHEPGKFITVAVAEEEERIVSEKVNETDLTPDQSGNSIPLPPPPISIPRWPFFVMAILILGAVVVWLLTRPDCMYWNNNRYVATSCSIPRLDTPIIPLDRAKLRGFRRVTRIDTLTSYSVGRLWYAHIADSMEIYTGGGNHPLYANKQLRKVTDYTIIICRKQHK
jgi:hypothetical protein